MNNIILFILLILLLFYYINKEYENYENNDSLGIYSSAATLDPPIEDDKDDKEDDKLEKLFKNNNNLRINKTITENKLIKHILKENKEGENISISIPDLINYYKSNKNIYSTNEQEEAESLIINISDYNDKIIENNSSINSLSSITVNETLQHKDSEIDSKTDIIHRSY